MAEFLETEALDVDLTTLETEGEYIATVSDEEFIDDADNKEQSEYPYFTNVTRSYSDEMPNIENINDLEARHYFDSDEEEAKLITIILLEQYCVIKFGFFYFHQRNY